MRVKGAPKAGKNERVADSVRSAGSAEQLRRRQVLEINDNIVQGLVVAKYALDADDSEHAREAVEQTLIAARRIITDLLDGSVTEELKMRPGDLIRLQPATVVLPCSG
jgi:hypothetical protein